MFPEGITEYIVAYDEFLRTWQKLLALYCL